MIFINCVHASFPLGFVGGMLDLIVLVPDHCLSFYFELLRTVLSNLSKFPFETSLGSKSGVTTNERTSFVPFF